MKTAPDPDRPARADADRYARRKELFLAVAELPAARREAFLAVECAGDAGLAREVRAMLETEKTLATPPTGDLSSEPLAGARFVPGTLLGRRYRIVGLLGRGGMGEVYQAEDLRLGETVALKLLSSGLARDEAALARLNQEVRLARQIAHPNVCRVFDIGEADGVAFLSMEFIDGEDLASLLRRIGRLPDAKAIEVARQLTAGLAAAHEKGVLHRDLKPANVMLDGRGRVRISDFGLATMAAEAAAAEVAGTPLYMAPEQLTRGEVSFRSDLYALGLVIYECLTGRRPFAAAHLPEQVSTQRAEPPESPSRWVPGLDPEIERMVLRCLEPEPSRRPATVHEVAAAFSGADPLALALAAGETPSPEMVAAAPRSGTMTIRGALGWTVLVAVSLPWLWVLGRDQLGGLGELPRPPLALADRAASLAETLGIDQPRDSVWGWRLRDPFLQRLGDLPGDEQRRLLAAEPVSPLRFWYRGAPTAMVALDGYTDPDDPPVGPGQVLIELDPAGRLRLLDRRLLVSGQPPSPPQASAAGWEELLAHAGVDAATLTPIAPRRLPPSYADRLLAWSGRLIDAETVTVTIEAAEQAGRPIFFELIEPVDSEPGTRQLGFSRILVGFIIPTAVISLVAGVWLARRNLVSRRGDPRGALRLGTLVATTSFVGWALAAHHPLSLPALSALLVQLGLSLLAGAYLWLLYLALEPALRRRWPEALVSWSRLLEGRFGDPLVAREVFVGFSLGLAVHAVDGAGLVVGRMVGAVPPLRLDRWLLPSLTGLGARIDLLLGNLTFVPLFNAFGLVLLLLGLEALVRRRELAAALLAAGIALLLWRGGPVGLAVAALQGALLVGTAARFGLLASTAQWVAFFAVLAMPAVPDWSTWSTAGSVVLHALIGAITVWAWRRSVMPLAGKG